MARATDDILIATPLVETYRATVDTFKGYWKVHDMGVVEHYIGLHFVHITNCRTIDQTSTLGP